MYRKSMEGDQATNGGQAPPVSWARGSSSDTEGNHCAQDGFASDFNLKQGPMRATTYSEPTPQGPEVSRAGGEFMI